MRPGRTVALAVVAVLALPACERAKEAAREKYYDTLDKVGVERREVLVNRVDNAREAQEKAQKRFRNAEIGQYTDANLAKESRRELGETRKRYDQLVGVMDKAAAKMDPVLAKFRDQVLFLKHNLNAKVLGSLEGTAATLETDVSTLIDEMQASIREADAFIRDMGKGN